MATQADDPVRDACDLLAAYLPRLQRLLPDPDSPLGYAAPGTSGGLAHAPLPGNAAVLLAATGIHAVARWWEAMLLYHHGGTAVWGRRGGSDANTVGALEAIVRLAAAADDDTVAMLLADLSRAEADAGAVRAIDETPQWRYLRGRPCPHCGCWALKVLLDASGRPTGHVECFGHGPGGRPCRQAAAAGTDERGRPVLEWSDGTVETVPDLEAA